MFRVVIGPRTTGSFNGGVLGGTSRVAALPRPARRARRKALAGAEGAPLRVTERSDMAAYEADTHPQLGTTLGGHVTDNSRRFNNHSQHALLLSLSRHVKPAFLTPGPMIT